MICITRLLIISLLAVSINAGATNAKIVNVLTWQGYLENPNIAKMVEKRCGVTLSYDTYISNGSMLRRWADGQNKYDILIFSYTIYDSIKNKISSKNSGLWRKSKKYHPAIREKYISGHFPNNVAYFAHALTGFLWNPAVIDLKEGDTAQTAFAKAKNNRIILLDDPVEVAMLLTVAGGSGLNNGTHHISLSDFNALVKNSNVYITSEENGLYNRDDFAFAYQWSGMALANMGKDNERYRFLVDEHLSYVSTDLIVQVSDDNNSACVANYLAGKEFLTTLQNESGYFSPYGNVGSVPNGAFKLIYEKFLKTLPRLHWLKPPTGEQLDKLNREWDVVKYELAQSE